MIVTGMIITNYKLSGRKKMKKDRREKMSFVGFLTASILYFIGSVLNFTDKNTGAAVMFLCLGFSFLCLSITHWPR